MDKRVKSLFERLERSLGDLDTGYTASLYADTFISAGPKGVIGHTKQETVELSKEAAAIYKSAGVEWTKLMSSEETWFSDYYLMVTVHWASKFKSVSAPVEYDVSYLVQLTDDQPKIVLFIAHQDEREAMKHVGAAA